MKVQEFVEKYVNAPSNAKDKIIKDIIKKDEYVPFENKIVICRSILEDTSVEDGVYHANSPIQTMVFSKTLVEAYTELEWDNTDGRTISDDFNALNKHGLITNIIASINPREVDEFATIMDMVKSDFIQNETEVHNFVLKLMGKMNFGLDKIIPMLNIPDDVKQKIFAE